MAAKLLVIDDDPVIGAVVARIGADCGYAVDVTETAQGFRASYAAEQPSAIVLDIVIPDTDGLELIGELAASNSRSKLIIISGYEQYRELAADYARFSGLDLVQALSKPLDHSALWELLLELR